MKPFIGLDLGLNKTAMCCIDQDGAVILQKTLPSEAGALLCAIERLSGTVELIDLEACPLSEWIYGALRPSGLLSRNPAHPTLPTDPAQQDRQE